MLDDPVDNFLQHLDSAKAVGRDKWEARCPAHDDRHASLSIGRGDDGRVLLHCHAGCSPVEVCSAMGLSLKALFMPKDQRHCGEGRIVATYDYRDGEGKLCYQVVRYKPKRFKQRRPDGQGGWIWSIEGVPRLLYRLPELRAADSNEPVLVVEGEKDVENLRKLGFVATCNSGGAEKWNILSDDSALHGRSVVVVADRDKAGHKHAGDVAARLSGRAAKVCVLELPGEGKDASDWIANGGTADQLRELIESTLTNPAPIPPEEATEPSESAPPTCDDEDNLSVGSIDPATGKLILSPAKTLPTALAFIQHFHIHKQHRTLHSYAGQFMAWRGNQYVPIEEQSLRQSLQPWLHDALRYQFDKRTGQLKLVGFDSNPRTISAALESIRTLVHLPASMTPPMWLDGQPDHPDPHNLLPFPSGTLDLTTRTILPPSPALFNINAIDFEYEANPEPPERWIRFLEQLWGDDLESVHLLQEWLGYCLVADTSQQKMLLIVGPKRSGKGTIGRVLRRLVGNDNVAGPTISSLGGSFGLQPLIGKSLAIVSDARFAGENISAVIERLLCISGEDTLTVDRKFMPSVTMKLPTRFMFLTNELPRMNDASGALAGRFVILRLTHSFYGQEDTTLTEQLMEELPGILQWAIEGLKRLRERGRFVQPQSVADAVQEMEDLSSPVGAFVRDCCVVGAGYRAWVDDLYKAWKVWCEADGRTSVTTKQTFGRDLSAAVPGVNCRRNRGFGRFYEGIGLLDKEGQDDPSNG